jgi:hypothetical protein
MAPEGSEAMGYVAFSIAGNVFLIIFVCFSYFCRYITNREREILFKITNLAAY